MVFASWADAGVRGAVPDSCAVAAGERVIWLFTSWMLACAVIQSAWGYKAAKMGVGRLGFLSGLLLISALELAVAWTVFE